MIVPCKQYLTLAKRAVFQIQFGKSIPNVPLRLFDLEDAS